MKNTKKSNKKYVHTRMYPLEYEKSGSVFETQIREQMSGPDIS